jgi:hypothetical protein
MVQGIHNGVFSVTQSDGAAVYPAPLPGPSFNAEFPRGNYQPTGKLKFSSRRGFHASRFSLTFGRES